MNQQCALALKKQLMQRNVVMGRSTAKPVEGFEELLFTTKFGTPINTQLYSAAIKAVLEDANLCRDELEQIDYFSPHCFRHSFATRCFEAGIKPKTVQQYLGHATLQMTMDLYTHVLKEHSMEEMSKLEKVLDNTLDVSETMINDRFDKFLDMVRNPVKLDA
jgi:integrase